MGARPVSFKSVLLLPLIAGGGGQPTVLVADHETHAECLDASQVLAATRPELIVMCMSEEEFRRRTHPSTGAISHDVQR